jgi:hypothetical protein
MVEPENRASATVLEVEPPLLVKPRINGGEAGWFYLDTGATGMVISPSAADRLGLPRLPAVTVHGARSFEAPCRGCDLFELGPVKLRELTLVEIDVGFIGGGRPANPPTTEPVCGIVGAEFFEQAVVELDLAGPGVRVLDRESPEAAGLEWRELVLTERGPAVKCRFLGAAGEEGGAAPVHEGLFVLDSGGQFSVGFHAPAVERFGLLEGRETRPLLSRGVGGMNSGQRGRIEWIEVAGRRIENAPAIFFGDREGVEYPEDQCGMIGRGVLRRFIVVLDYERGRVAFRER